MVQRLAVISGQEIVGRQTQAGSGHHPKNHIIPNQPNDQRLLFIKLPRATVDACARLNRRSLAFSHERDITGREAVIYATGDHKGFRTAYRGKVERMASTGKREFAIVDAVPITQSEWNADYANKVPKKKKR